MLQEKLDTYSEGNMLPLKIAYNIYSKGTIICIAVAKSLQLCPTLCDPVDGSPPGSPVPGILQARTLEWVAISFCNAGKWKVKVKSLSRVQPSATPWTSAFQLLRPWGFPGKSTGVGCHCLLRSWIPKVIYLISCKRRLWFSMRQRVCFHAQNYIEKLNKTCCLPG